VSGGEGRERDAVCEKLRDRVCGCEEKGRDREKVREREIG